MTARPNATDMYGTVQSRRWEEYPNRDIPSVSALGQNISYLVTVYNNSDIPRIGQIRSNQTVGGSYGLFSRIHTLFVICI